MSKQLSVADQHVLKISRDSMRMHCAGVRIMGGPNHRQAAENIARITGKRVKCAPDCNCVDVAR